MLPDGAVIKTDRSDQDSSPWLALPQNPARTALEHHHIRKLYSKYFWVYAQYKCKSIGTNFVPCLYYLF